MNKYVLIEDAYNEGFDCEYNTCLILETKEYVSIVGFGQNFGEIIVDILEPEYGEQLTDPFGEDILKIAGKKYKGKYKMPTFKELQMLYKQASYVKMMKELKKIKERK